jgi:hypothetical protein
MRAERLCDVGKKGRTYRPVALIIYQTIGMLPFDVLSQFAHLQYIKENITAVAGEERLNHSAILTQL